MSIFGTFSQIRIPIWSLWFAKLATNFLHDGKDLKKHSNMDHNLYNAAWQNQNQPEDNTRCNGTSVGYSKHFVVHLFFYIFIRCLEIQSKIRVICKHVCARGFILYFVVFCRLPYLNMQVCYTQHVQALTNDNNFKINLTSYSIKLSVLRV